MRIELNKLYVKEPYDVGGNQLEFTPSRPSDVSYIREEEYCFCEGGVFSSGFYMYKLIETVHLWLNKDTNTCIELIDRKDYNVDIRLFSNSWKLKRDYVIGPNKYTIKPEYPHDDDNSLWVIFGSFAKQDSILYKFTLPMIAKKQILEFIGENTNPNRIVYDV